MRTPTFISKPAEQSPLDSMSYFSVGSFSLFRRWLKIFEWILISLLLVQIGWRTAPKAWHTINTDFPNYYLTARLTREHYDTSRIYEWIWLQRQKDHRAIDQRIVGMVPITPFSTLVLYPIASMPPMEAKHCWLIVNVGLLFATLFFLRSLTMLPWRHILLIAVLSFPLRVNFLLGQYYVLLLFLLTMSCWLYLRQRRFMAGVLIGLAAGLKIFPAVYFLFFLRKKDWKACAGGLLASLGSFAVSITFFGWKLNHLYLTQVLPATFRGEGLAPYNLQAASLTSLLHRLFIYEPQLNPHPALNAPGMFSLLHPLLSMAVLAPAILLATPDNDQPRRARLEWAAVLLASLTISTSPASYLFTLLILPAAIIWGSLRQERKDLWSSILLSLYAAAGFLGGKTDANGWAALIGVPRLYALILFVAFSYVVLIRLYPRHELKRDRTLWIFALLAVLIFGIATNFRHQEGLYADYDWRIAEPAKTLMSVHPAVQGEDTLLIALLFDGYHSAIVQGEAVKFRDTSDKDQLAITATRSEAWVEQAGNESIVQPMFAEGDDIRQAESPVISSDDHWLAFLREDHGRARIWVHALDQRDISDKLVTPPELNVMEMSFLPHGALIFAASSKEDPALFIADQNGTIKSLNIKNARYPSVSPDGHWLAYSQLHNGNWNLWLRNLSNGQTDRLTHAECNDTEPAWTGDSKTLIYASDCGRGLWLSGLCRRHILP